MSDHYKDFLKMDVKVYEHGVFIFVHGVLLPKLCCIAASSYPESVSGYFLSVNNCKHSLKIAIRSINKLNFP